MSESIAIGKPAPLFALPATSGGIVELSALRGKHVVLYFYPKDDTPGCTQEGKDFSCLVDQFKKQNAVILGVSRDTAAQHEKFKAKYTFDFELLSDSDGKVCQLYDVIKSKNMYGKQVQGIERSTFLIDRDGLVQKIWRKVKVEGHAEEVLAVIE